MKTLALARVSASACTSPSEGSPVHRMAYTSHPQFLWDFTRNRAEGNAALSAARIWTAACLRGTCGVSFVMPLLRTIASVPAGGGETAANPPLDPPHQPYESVCHPPLIRRFARTGALRAKSGPAGYRGGREYRTSAHLWGEPPGTHERVDHWIEKRQGRLAGVLPSFVEQGAQPGPSRRAPTGSTDLNGLSIEHEESAVIGIGRKTDVRDETIVARRHPRSALPWRSREQDAPATAPTCHENDGTYAVFEGGWGGTPPDGGTPANGAGRQDPTNGHSLRPAHSGPNPVRRVIGAVANIAPARITGSTDLNGLSIEHEESAVIGIGRKTDVRDETIVARRHPRSALPWRSREQDAPATAPTCHENDGTYAVFEGGVGGVSFLAHQ